MSWGLIVSNWQSQKQNGQLKKAKFTFLPLYILSKDLYGVDVQIFVNFSFDLALNVRLLEGMVLT